MNNNRINLMGRFLRRTRRIIRNLSPIDKRLIKTYLESELSPKLNLGAGDTLKSGWLNTDLYPHDDVIRIDATKKFPLPNAAFDYVFSEHMIEHIPLNGALNMLSECHRILKSGGVIRIVTPDFRFLQSLYRVEKNDQEKKYIEWSHEKFIGGDIPVEDIFVINNFHHAWGHQFIHDEKSLSWLMKEAGFQDIESCQLGVSKTKAFSEVDTTERLPERFLFLESLVMEARKVS